MIDTTLFLLASPKWDFKIYEKEENVICLTFDDGTNTFTILVNPIQLHKIQGDVITFMTKEEEKYEKESRAWNDR